LLDPKKYQGPARLLVTMLDMHGRTVTQAAYCDFDITREWAALKGNQELN